ncbi:MAG: sulfite exporter TauE/SafE family protein [Aestuariibacter sp.]|nr:sulfite exporter TauE/SafE family protein [Aestuariibacter sp.]
MIDPQAILIITFSFTLAGIVKGVTGFGMPVVSLGLLVTSFDLTTAMALFIVPSFVTNLWQAVSGGQLLSLFRQIWSYLLLAVLAVWIGSIALIRVELHLLSTFLGGLLIFYSLLCIFGYRLNMPPARERWLAPILGSINGILAGMTGAFIVPGVMYLQAIGLSRDQLVQAMGMLFAALTVALACALQYRNFSSTELNLISLAAVLPAMMGMWIGRKIRKSLPEQQFQSIFYSAMFLLGVFIAIKSLLI